MSTCTNLQLPATDSQDLGRLDSFSLPPEPPDIRNWFSSYAYESPDLNTLDGLKEFDVSGDTLDEEGKSGKYGDSQPAAKADDALLAASKESPDEIKFNESDDSECSKYAAMVNELSESLSFSSEPPDIRNWFSSYLYESLPPPVDTTHEFSISDYKEREDGKSCDVKMSCIQDNKDSLALNDAKEREESRNLAVVVRCNDTVISTESDRQTVGKNQWCLVSVYQREMGKMIANIRESGRETGKMIANMEIQKKGKKQPTWEVIKGLPSQPDDKQCGFFVMRYMRQLIDEDATADMTSLRSIFAHTKEYSAVDIDEVRIEWAECVQEHIS